MNIHLEPHWPLFLKVNSQNKAEKFQSNPGPIGFNNSTVARKIKAPSVFQPWFMISMEDMRTPGWNGFHMKKLATLKDMRWPLFGSSKKEWQLRPKIYPYCLAFTMVSLILGCFFFIQKKMSPTWTPFWWSTVKKTVPKPSHSVETDQLGSTFSTSGATWGVFFLQMTY